MTLLRPRFLLVSLFSLIFLGCTPGPNDPSGNWGHMMGHGYGGGFMWFIVLVVVGVILFYLLQALQSKGSDASIKETPMDILKKRYAQGEIDKDEFVRMKKDLES